MTNTSIQTAQPNGGALSAEHYQSFELAKENDDVLGGDNIAQIRSYAAYARAQAQAIHKTIAATSGLDDVAAIKAEATETAQTFAKVGIYADQRIGEILRELPKGSRWKSDSPTGESETKAGALQSAGISRSEAYRLEELAANPEVVQAVLDKAEAEGRIPSRKQVLDAIRERDDARETVSMVKRVGDTLKEQRDKAQADLERAREEIKALERQNDQLYEQANAASAPQVVERTVEVAPADYESVKHERDVYLADIQKLRKRNEDMRRELDKAKDLLGMDKTMQDVRKDVQYLVSATNQYVRHYGGLTWTAASLEQLDQQTLEEFRKAAINLATFANALVASLEDTK